MIQTPCTFDPLTHQIKEEIVAQYPVESIADLYPKDVKSCVRHLKKFVAPSAIRAYVRAKNDKIKLPSDLNLKGLIRILFQEPFYELVDNADKSGKELTQVTYLHVVRDLIFTTQAFDPSMIRELILTYGDSNIDYAGLYDSLMTMLKYIPPDKQVRVIDRIAMETVPRKFTTSHMMWWTIQPQWRILHFILNRDGYDIPVTLMWKKTDPSAQLSLFTPSRDWIPNKQAGNIGFGIEFHYEAYQHLRTSFIEWLSNPLELPFPLRQSA